MKITRFFLAILTLFTASCNPDEDLNDGSNNNGSGNGGGSGNTNNMSFDEAVQTIQGTWYLALIENWEDGHCIGEDRYCSHRENPDLDYMRWRIDFSATENTGSSLFTSGIFGMVGSWTPTEIHTNYLTCFSQGNSTPYRYFFYRELIDPTLQSFVTTDTNSVDLRIGIEYINNGGLNSNYYSYKVVELSDSNLVLQCYAPWAFPATSNTQTFYKFIRTQESILPSLETDISGEYFLIRKRQILDNVVQFDQAYEPSLNYTSLVFSDSLLEYPNNNSAFGQYSQKLGFAGGMDYGLTQISGLGGAFNVDNSNNFYYSIKDNRIIANRTSNSTVNIHSFSNDTLVLRYLTECYTYEELTFYKIP
jgi:hypothetical protein